MVPDSDESINPHDGNGNPAHDSDSGELLRRFAEGDESAFTELVKRESPRILRRIRDRLPRALRRRVGESDILQLASIDLLAVRERFENRGLNAFRGLLDTIADINVARALEREKAQKRNIDIERSLAGASGTRGTPGSPFDDLAGSASSPSSPLHRKENAALLTRCFALLREKDREVIRLIDYDEIGYIEAASRLGIEPDALRRRHSRAIARLRALFGKSRGEMD